MNILIRTAGGVPIHEQIFTQLRDEICSGALPPGEALPSIRSLARSPGVGHHDKARLRGAGARRICGDRGGQGQLCGRAI